MLDLSSLGKAIASLKRGLIRAQADLSDEEIRDGAIQRFEYTFELCWKMLKRQLQIEVPNSSDVDGMSFRELIREGFERGYIDNPEDWFLFREHRNAVSHSYNEERAKLVFQSAVAFEPIARSLFESLKAKNHD